MRRLALFVLAVANLPTVVLVVREAQRPHDAPLCAPARRWGPAGSGTPGAQARVRLRGGSEALRPGTVDYSKWEKVLLLLLLVVVVVVWCVVCGVCVCVCVFVFVFVCSPPHIPARGTRA